MNSNKHNKTKNKKKRKDKNKVNKRWVSLLFPLTVCISALFSMLSTVVFDRAGVFAACAVLMLIVLVGIIFDVLGVAVTAADIKPFHSMASHKARGAKEAINLIINADKVSSFCNDVVGDICGVVSGVASASLVLLLVSRLSVTDHYLNYMQIALAALVSGMTVGGKAIGKTIAITKSTKIVHVFGIVIYTVKQIPGLFNRKLPRKN